MNELKRYYHLNDNHEEMLMAHTISSSNSEEKDPEESVVESQSSSEDEDGAEKEEIRDTMDYAINEHVRRIALPDGILSMGSYFVFSNRTQMGFQLVRKPVEWL